MLATMFAQGHPGSMLTIARRGSLMAATIILMVVAIACSDDNARLDSPPSLNAFAWGESLETSADRLARLGWQKDRMQDGRLFLTLPIASEEDQAAANMMGTAAPDKYRIILNGPADKLFVTIVQRNDSNAEIETFFENVKSAYKLNAPAWDSGPGVETTDAGNKLTDQTRIYETDDLLIVATTNKLEANERVSATDTDLGDGTSLELILYSRSLNEGISVDALAGQFESNQN